MLAAFLQVNDSDDNYSKTGVDGYDDINKNSNNNQKIKKQK